MYFRIYEDFDADIKTDTSSKGNKKNNIYKQNPVCSGYYIMSEINDVSKSGYYALNLGYDIVDWFVEEVLKIENKMPFSFKKTIKILF